MESASGALMRGESSAVGRLLSLGSVFDALGYDAFGPGSLNFLCNRKTVQEIERAYPRGKFTNDVQKAGEKEPETKPDCIMDHFRGAEFKKNMRAAPLGPVDETAGEK
ncbi:hypothetical protein DFH09DRAFT_1072363 [Mycena vulgaris]|nr:hypothetical protein DFH09DRAFT_1072363 [Mycena vulgaris]